MAPYETWNRLTAEQRVFLQWIGIVKCGKRLIGIADCNLTAIK